MLSGQNKRWALALVVPAAALLAWHLSTSGKGLGLIPPPWSVATQWWDLAFGGIWNDGFSRTLLEHTLASLSRVLGGFALAAIAAIPLGMMIGRVALIRDLLDPMLQLLRPIPVTAWLPLALIILGIGTKSTLFLVFLGSFYPIFMNTVFGVRSVETRLFEAAAMLGITTKAMFWKVVLPAALPSIFTGLRLGLGIAWVVIVIGEMTGVSTGLGAIIMEARQVSRTDVVLCGMATIGALGFISDQLVQLAGYRLLRWSPQHG